MSKYTGRMNRLFLKTHFFFSHGDHCLIRDYYKALYEESEKPEDFDERYEQLLELKKKHDNSKNEETWLEVKKFINENLYVWYKHRYLLTVNQCEKYPKGVLVNKKLGKGFVNLVNDARSYFKRKSEKDIDEY